MALAMRPTSARSSALAVVDITRKKMAERMDGQTQFGSLRLAPS